MAVKMWTKPETQSTIKQLRDAGYTIKKVHGIYKIIDDETNEPWIKDGKPLFTAIPDTFGYLIHYHADLMG